MTGDLWLAAAALAWALAIAGICRAFGRAGHGRGEGDQAAIDQAIALTRPPAPGRIPVRTPAPGHHRGPLRSVTKNWACGCTHTWKSPHNVLTYPCPAGLDAEIRDLLP